MHRLIISLALAGTLGVTAVACGSSTTTGAATSVTALAGTAAASTPYNTADVTFAQSMVPHHQQAVTMADIALEAKAGASQPVKDLATRIKAAQGPEITMMQGWLSAWGGSTTSTSVMGMDHSTTAMSGTAEMSGTEMSGTAVTGMDGMMSDADMTALGAATGKAFDTMWLTMMVKHHQGAVTMSQTELTVGTNADAKTLAGRIITAQNIEIAEMSKLLAA